MQLDLDNIQALANNIASHIKHPDCILLEGDLGSGKTTLVRHIIMALCQNNLEVPSPTFNIVYPYTSASGKSIMHFDLYRINNAQDLEEIGIEEMLDSSIALIEWPQVATCYIPTNHLHIHLSETKQENVRSIKLSGTGHWNKFQLLDNYATHS